VFDTQIAYSLLEELQGAPRVIDQTYISFVKLLEDKRYCGKLTMGSSKNSHLVPFGTDLS
jgi:hypothetical protein